MYNKEIVKTFLNFLKCFLKFNICSNCAIRRTKVMSSIYCLLNIFGSCAKIDGGRRKERWTDRQSLLQRSSAPKKSPGSLNFLISSDAFLTLFVKCRFSIFVLKYTFLWKVRLPANILIHVFLSIVSKLVHEFFSKIIINKNRILPFYAYDFMLILVLHFKDPDPVFFGSGHSFFNKRTMDPGGRNDPDQEL